jgi:hypothetical protein
VDSARRLAAGAVGLEPAGCQPVHDALGDDRARGIVRAQEQDVVGTVSHGKPLGDLSAAFLGSALTP